MANFNFSLCRANLKSPTLSVDEGAYDLDDEDHAHQPSQWDYVPDKADVTFSADMRELFAEYFVEHFANYEKFIIVPRQNYQQWQKNREQFQNFDKTAYLSDQPLVSQAFYSAFLETSIFTVFVDDKIIALFQPEQCRQNLAMFDSRIESHRDKSGLAKPPTPGYRTSSKLVGVVTARDVQEWACLTGYRTSSKFSVKEKNALEYGICA